MLLWLQALGGWRKARAPPLLCAHRYCPGAPVSEHVSGASWTGGWDSVGKLMHDTGMRCDTWGLFKCH